MKKIYIAGLIVLFPFILMSQKEASYGIADSIINVKEILKKEFPPETVNKFEFRDSLDGPFLTGLLKFKNILEKDSNLMEIKVPGACNCQFKENKLIITNAFGLMAGIANVIVVDISTGTYESIIYHNTDGAQSHKIDIEGDFVENISIPLEESKLVFSSDAKFEYDVIIQGILAGTSVKYYESEYNDLGYKESQTEVISIFKCKPIDYESIRQNLIEHEKKLIDKKRN